MWRQQHPLASATLLGAIGSLLIGTLLPVGASSCPNGTVPFPRGSGSCSTGTIATFDACCEPFDAAYTESLSFLLENMPAFDRANQASLFNGGIAGVTPNASLSAKVKFVSCN